MVHGIGRKGTSVGKVIDMNEKKKKRAGGDSFDAGWDAALPLAQLLLDYMSSDANDDAKDGFEAAIMGIIPNDALLTEIGFRMHTVDDDTDDT